MTPGSVPQSMGTIPFPGGLYVNVDTGKPRLVLHGFIICSYMLHREQR